MTDAFSRNTSAPDRKTEGTEKPFGCVTLDFEVTDAQAMWEHAYAVFEQTCGTADQSDFEDQYGTRNDPNISECMRMILDPAESPPGVVIHNSTVASFPETFFSPAA